jgi:hypothetical protein
MERPKDQRPTHLHAIGELFPPDKEEDGYARGHLFCFSFSFSPFHPFTMNVIRALPLEAIKGVAEVKKREEGTTPRIHLNQNQTSRTTTHKRPGICSLSLSQSL